MDHYAMGQGHVDLANRLGIESAHNIALSGSANSRILRTALKHSYAAAVPTFYVLGMTFVSRLELPICEEQNTFEGRWVNPQNQEFKPRWQINWTEQDRERFVETKLKSEIFSIVDRTEDLMYRMLSTIRDLKSRGHQALLYQQADNLYQEHLHDPKLALLNSCTEIVHGFRWRATAYQHEQHVPGTKYAAESQFSVPPDMVHPAAGEHHVLNTYLTNYMNEHKILQCVISVLFVKKNLQERPVLQFTCASPNAADRNGQNVVLNWAFNPT
jgi:hypothetical protein